MGGFNFPCFLSAAAAGWGNATAAKVRKEKKSVLRREMSRRCLRPRAAEGSSPGACSQRRKRSAVGIWGDLLLQHLLAQYQRETRGEGVC